MAVKRAIVTKGPTEPKMAGGTLLGALVRVRVRVGVGVWVRKMAGGTALGYPKVLTNRLVN